MNQNFDTLVDHLFRHEHGKMVSVLMRVFGLVNIDLAEDIVQDTFYKALKTWRFKGLPENPSAWLMKVAKNGAIDVLRKKATATHYQINLSYPAIDENIDSFFYESEIEDNQLRLIFTCCHPDLKDKDQIAFTLKTVSGFGVKEIAKALIATKESIKKRLQRARSQIIKSQLDFEIPTGKDLETRLESVLSVLYLLFNEGYNSSKQDELIRRDLCAEAMRLCKLVDEHPSISSGSTSALLAMMCYHAARFESRMTPDNEIILLSEQDRSKWNRDLIFVGNKYMNKSIQMDHYSVYHIEAGIAAEHCMAVRFEETNWKNLLKLYEMLYKVKPGPFVLLNKIVVLLQLNELNEARVLIESIDPGTLVNTTHLYHSVAAEVYHRFGENENTFSHLTAALEYAPTDAEEKLLRRKMNLMEKR